MGDLMTNEVSFLYNSDRDKIELLLNNQTVATLTLSDSKEIKKELNHAIKTMQNYTVATQINARKEQQQKILEYIQKNPTDSNRIISSELDVSKHHIIRVKRKHGLQRKKHTKLTQDEINFILQNRNLSVKDIGQKLDRSIQIVYKILQQHQIDFKYKHTKRKQLPKKQISQDSRERIRKNVQLILKNAETH